ncbi:unnamed protein product, partial [Schistosoma guineensis]
DGWKRTMQFTRSRNFRCNFFFCYYVVPRSHIVRKDDQTLLHLVSYQKSVYQRQTRWV